MVEGDRGRSAGRLNDLGRWSERTGRHHANRPRNPTRASRPPVDAQKETTMTTSRPAQLAPVRIGRGNAVHLGCRSSITGPNGEPRYVAAWCGASGSGDTIRAGEAATDPSPAAPASVPSPDPSN